MSKTRTISCGRLVRGPNGRYLCRYCQTEVKPPRRTFCSDECVEEWSIRSNPGYAKAKVYRRDKGICCLCGLDTDALTDLFTGYERIFIKKNGYFYLLPKDPGGAVARLAELSVNTFTDLDDKAKMSEWSALILKYPWAYKALRGGRRCLWDMDHLTPVVEGGGQCGLDNLRTLCMACHLKETRELRKRLSRKKALTPVPVP